MTDHHNQTQQDSSYLVGVGVGRRAFLDPLRVNTRYTVPRVFLNPDPNPSIDRTEHDVEQIARAKQQASMMRACSGSPNQVKNE